jgi:hypothetical protein
VWSAKHAIARSAKGLRQQTRSHVQADRRSTATDMPSYHRPAPEPVDTVVPTGFNQSRDRCRLQIAPSSEGCAC